MILVVEIILGLIAVYALVTGKFPMHSGARYVLRGWRARVIGGIGLLPVPLTLLVGTATGLVLKLQGKPVTRDSFFLIGAGIEVACVVVCVVAMVVLKRICGTRATAADTPDSRLRFHAPLQTILQAIDDVLRDMKVKALKWSDDGRRVTGKIGISAWSWGEWLRVEADESGEVRVESTSAVWAVIDWGKNAENRRRFLKRLTARLESTVEA